MNKKKTTIINLYGGPGTGKSSTAAKVYSAMKELGLSVEMVREYVKDWAWEGKAVSHKEQIYLFAKQSKREGCLYGKVDFVVTDSPLTLPEIYEDRYFGRSILTSNLYDRWLEVNKDVIDSIHVFIKREGPYETRGRFETEEEARELDFVIKDFLVKKKFQVIEAPYSKVTEIILDYVYPERKLSYKIKLFFTRLFSKKKDKKS